MAAIDIYRDLFQNRETKIGNFVKNATHRQLYTCSYRFYHCVPISNFLEILLAPQINMQIRLASQQDTNYPVITLIRGNMSNEEPAAAGRSDWSQRSESDSGVNNLHISMPVSQLPACDQCEINGSLCAFKRTVYTTRPLYSATLETDAQLTRWP